MENQQNLKHIELFAGCGGMTLGLESAGFQLYFANELSPMAGETFAYNLLQEDLQQLSAEGNRANKSLWIKSKFKKNELKKRLRENPFEARKYNESDLEATTDLQDKLLIGDIDHLIEWLSNNPSVVEQIKKHDITLLSGGPPCQSFSLAGKRERTDVKNLLPLSFAKFAGLVKPKFVLLENVKGITAPFTENGKKHYAWFEVAKAFVLEGYVPICMLLNSKYFGVPQNRPRFIMLAIKVDIAKLLVKKRKDKRLEESLNFYSVVSKYEGNCANISMDLLQYYDLETNQSLYNGFLFPKISTPDGQLVSAAEAIGDLKKTGSVTGYSKSRVVYRDYLNATFTSPSDSHSGVLYNHEPRGHNYDVKARFRLYQIINEFKNGNRKVTIDAILGKKIEKDKLFNLAQELSGYEIYMKNGGPDGYYRRLSTPEDVESYLKSIATKKHSQRALKEDEPAPAQLTIPDDYGSLMQSTGGKLYGLTYNGGNGDRGVIFSYNPVGNVFSRLINFGVNNTGSSVYGGMIKDASGRLYGMTNRGGSYARGVLFRFDPSTSVYSKLLDFNGNNGENPFGSLMLASDGKLYGMTLGGGINGAGIIFSFDPLTSTFSKLKDFDNINGSAPYGNLLQATNGLFYGLTNSGGLNEAGVLFSFDPSTAVYTKLFDFGGTAGAYPTGSLMQSKHGELYGVTYNGGTNDWGVLFTFNPDNGLYKKLVGFDATTGINPNGMLVQPNNNKLYGMTSYGNFGTIFSYDPFTTVFAKIKDFNYTDGATPNGSLINGSDGKLYGMTKEGGSYKNGVCFSLDPVTDTFKKIQDFNYENGRAPEYTFFTELNNPASSLDLISFTAIRNGRANLLSWTTAQEINTDHFEIERSPNTRDFLNIGTVQSFNNGMNKNDYQFTDAQPLKAVNYYRLKILGKDGRFTYSSLKSTTNTYEFDLAIYPNPIQEIVKLNFNTEKALDVTIQVVNVAGKTVYKQRLQLPYGTSIQKINLATLSNGHYFLKCITTYGDTELKIIKE